MIWGCLIIILMFYVPKNKIKKEGKYDKYVWFQYHLT